MEQMRNVVTDKAISAATLRVSESYAALPGSCEIASSSQSLLLAMTAGLRVVCLNKSCPVPLGRGLEMPPKCQGALAPFS